MTQGMLLSDVVDAFVADMKDKGKLAITNEVVRIEITKECNDTGGMDIVVYMSESEPIYIDTTPPKH